MHDITRSLVRDFGARGIPIQHGVTRREIVAFENLYSVQLTEEAAAAYFETVGGMANAAMDPATKLRLWPLAEVEPAAKWLGHDDAYAGCFIFADFLLWSHAYAIRLGTTRLTSSEVVLVGGIEPIIEAPSLTKFFEKQLSGE